MVGKESLDEPIISKSFLHDSSKESKNNMRETMKNKPTVKRPIEQNKFQLNDFQLRP